MANPKLAVLDKCLGSIENGVINQGKYDPLPVGVARRRRRRTRERRLLLRRLAVLEEGPDRVTERSCAGPLDSGRVL